MNKKLRSLQLSLLLDERVVAARRFAANALRKVAFRKPVVSVFLQLDDPYSYLLAHYLPRVTARYKSVDFRVYICQALRGEYMPQPALLAEYAMEDCKSLAQEFDIPFLDKGDAPAVELRRPLMDYLAVEQGEEDFAETVIAALTGYWRGDVEGASRMVGNTRVDSKDTSVLIGQNQLLLRKLGHYNCATMHFDGEWYWGIDRLHFLVDRLDKLGLSRFGEPTPELASLNQATRLLLPATKPESAGSLPELEYFHSFRSPYSYIGLHKAFRIAEGFGLSLNVKPVLPMAMRGLSVPQSKLKYILQDASRVARRNDIPFGRIADSLGAGVERCMAAFCYARNQRRERDFVLEAGRAIFADAIDVATDEGMQAVAERSGLFWPELESALQQDDWRDEEKINRDRLDDLGHWGVPVFKVGEQALWGQDRDWLIARRIEDLCHAGDGIMI